MGGLEGQAMMNGFIPNGLLPDAAASVTRGLDQDRWSRAEERTAELIAHIQPNQSSEERRNAVAAYVQSLIMNCFSCQVFTFGSVPLKTYLPDGDLDLTAFSNNQNFKDSWPHEVRDILENEEKSEDAEFGVKEVQYIQAEVKIIKCLVEDIVVDISFNQLGGLCTLCFLEEVDDLISQNHLFKRSTILIKAWCYYESRILGAHHGLISSYALEILVLYIFHVYNNTFAGPLEVLYRFLEFFSKFDWDNYCLSLWGPVPVGSLPNMRAEPPRKDSGELLLSKLFLHNCSSVYAVMPNGQESQEQSFVSKYLNIIDPLRANNNLGRSVSKGNFFRIRSAFAFGAQKIVKLLDCPEENLISEFDLFFRNTWDRDGKDHRPDAPDYDFYARNKELTEISTCHESEVEQFQDSHAPPSVYCQHANHMKESKKMFGTFDLKHTSSMKIALSDGGLNPNNLVKEAHATHHSSRSHPSPEFAHISSEFPSQRRHIESSETGKGQSHSVSCMNDDSKRLIPRSKVLDNHSGRVSAENKQSSWKTSSVWRSDDGVESKKFSNSYNGECLGFIKDGNSFNKAMWTQQEEQDYMNMTATYSNHRFNGYVQVPMSVYTNLPYSVPPSVLTSGYTHANSFGMLPANIPSIESLSDQNLPYSQALVPVPALQCFPSVEITEPADDNSAVAELNPDERDGSFWSDQDVNSVRWYDYDDGYIQPKQQRDSQMVAAIGSSSGNSFLPTSSANFSPKRQGAIIENRWLTRENYGDDPPDDRTIESDVNSTASSRLSPAPHSTLRTNLFSGSFSNASPFKASRDQVEIKTAYPTPTSAVHERQYEGKLINRISSPPDDDSGEWIRQSTAGTDSAESMPAETVTAGTDGGRGPMTVSNSSLPITPAGSDSRQRVVNNQEPLPFSFYPPGSPFPFFTMVPFYGLPAETGTSYGATNAMDTDAELGNVLEHQCSDSLESTERLEHSDTFNKSNHIRHDATSQSFEKHKSDILNGDFPSHWQNLQYGRFCQNALLQGPLPYFTSFVPPMYLQGQLIWDGPGRPSVNKNIMARGPNLVPMMQTWHSHMGNGWYFAVELPRNRSGTGTYLPNPRYYRNRHYSNTRNHRGSYNYDRKDHLGERDGNWNSNPKPRFANHGRFRHHVERPGSRMNKTDSSNRQPDRPWNSSKHGSFFSCNSHNGSFNSSMSSKHVAANMQHGMHPPAVVGAGTNDTSHQGERSHSSVNELANFEGESAESFQPSSPNFSSLSRYKRC